MTTAISIILYLMAAFSAGVFGSINGVGSDKRVVAWGYIAIALFVMAAALQVRG